MENVYVYLCEVMLKCFTNMGFFNHMWHIVLSLWDS